ncbi:DUF4432 family protein [Phaeovulum sp. W22_SRMD_FR3]|uniref:DUF4432 family protein n=1 Tax=Phaeovulum sp. W22_SRMD_FR3 TaxID=3240274 RepID=UPI003F97EF6A
MMKVNLSESMFGTEPFVLFEHPRMSAVAFRYPSGIAGLRLITPRVSLVALPFRGQQIWEPVVDGLDIGMQGMTRQPVPSERLLDGFGAFFFHCGLTGTSAPGPEDDHALHGELPMAPMQQAWLEIDLAGDAPQITLRSATLFQRAYKAHYRAEPYVTLTAGAPVFEVGMRVTNLGGAPMPFMYLAHPNFRPVDGGRLVYSAPYTPEAVRVRAEVPSHLTVKPEFSSLLKEMQEDPSAHHLLEAGRSYDPEVVFQIDYRADSAGWAHSMQVHPDGSADWFAHRPEQCPKALRWISRSPDLQALAMAEPTTSGQRGYRAEAAAGTVPLLDPGATWVASFRMGRLDAAETAAQQMAVDQICGRGA